jgi:hypothetical protein
MKSVDSVFRTQMRALAQKDGAVTKLRYGSGPSYYRDIGRLGGSASVAARKARIAAEAQAPKTGEAPVVEPDATQVEVTPPLARAVVTLRDILADIERDGPCVPDTSNRRLSLADLQAERDFAGWVARIRDEQSDEDERWDPWSSLWKQPKQPRKDSFERVPTPATRVRARMDCRCVPMRFVSPACVKVRELIVYVTQMRSWRA